MGFSISTVLEVDGERGNIFSSNLKLWFYPTEFKIGRI